MSLFSLDGRHALVTGGARGVGLMCARALLSHGASVTITSRSRGEAERVCGELRTLGPCDFLVCDLIEPDNVMELGRQLRMRTDTLDIVINNAGVTWGAKLEEYPPEAWAKVLRLDVAVPFQVIQETLPLLAAAAEGRPPARVVNIGSIDGHMVGGFDNFAYGAAKAGLHQLTRVLASRLAPRGITVNAIAPGPIHTDMMSTLVDGAASRMPADNPLGRLCEYEDIAGVLIYLTAQAGSYVTGAIVNVDGGFSLAPWWRPESGPVGPGA